MRTGLLVIMLVGVLGIALGAWERPVAEPALHLSSDRGHSLDAAELIAELGCAACHAGVSHVSTIRRRAPRLQDAGLRYRPSYVFDFLQNPTRVRRHIGRSRMPGFHLDEAESVALTLHLETRTQAMAPDVPDPTSDRDNAQRGEQLIGELGCTGCHTLGSEGVGTALELTNVGKRVQGPWLRRFLTDPTAFDSATPMPAIFFERAARGVYEPRTPGGAALLESVSEFLDQTSSDERRALERAYEAAKRRHPRATAEVGERMYGALGCAECHEAGAAPIPANAPDLAAVGSRVRADWLRAYLTAPHVIRPFGFIPGTGSRMPDFRLSADEAASITAFLTANSGAPTREPPALSAFARHKAERLLSDRLSCLGCHRLDGEGGRIGPDLSTVSTRLRPEYLAAVIRDPTRVLPNSVMPVVPMPRGQLDLLATYLATRTPTEVPSAEYLSLVENEPQPIMFQDTGPALYKRYCAMCHGTLGQGDGYNAPFLPVSPTRHADSSYMASRPDDTLYDGIHAGGYILNRDRRMPGFGHTLSTGHLDSLVGYLRELCRCSGPVWSRDGVVSR